MNRPSSTERDIIGKWKLWVSWQINRMNNLQKMSNNQANLKSRYIKTLKLPILKRRLEPLIHTIRCIRRLEVSVWPLMACKSLCSLNLQTSDLLYLVNLFSSPTKHARRSASCATLLFSTVVDWDLLTCTKSAERGPAGAQTFVESSDDLHRQWRLV